MIDLDSVVVFKVDSLLARGNVLDHVDASVWKGTVDVLDKQNISELDVILGEYNLKRYDTPKIALEGTEPLVLKVGEILINENIATADECYDIRSILTLLGGSAGYKRCRYVLEQEFQDYELQMLVVWLYAMHVLRFNTVQDLKIGVEAKESEYRDSKDMKIQVAEVIEAYQLDHTFRGDHLIMNERITVIPGWWWIQKLKDDRK